MPTDEMIRNAIHELRSVYNLQTVSVFGSYADRRATEQSDLDLLVEFDLPNVSLIKLNALKYDLEDILGLPVDIIHAPLPADSMIHPGKVVRILWMRDITAHKYQTLRKEDVYSTCVDDIPVFEKQLQELIARSMNSRWLVRIKS